MPENTPETPGTAPVAAATQDPEIAARIAALDRKITAQAKQLADYQTLLANKEFAAMEAQTKLVEVSTKAQTFEQQMAEITKARDEAATKAANLEQQVSRQSVFMKPEFADLARHEAKNLLRKDLTGEEFEKYLADFKAEVGNVADSQLKAVLSGTTPPSTPSPANNGQPTPDMLMNEFDALMKKPVLTPVENQRMLQLTNEIALASPQK